MGTQVATENRLIDDEGDLKIYFGSLAITVLTLYQSIAGGLDWGQAAEALAGEVSMLSVAVLVMYIAFCSLCLMNVVTGIFVETAVSNATADQNIYVSQTVLEMFKKAELNDKGEITWDTFKTKLMSPEF